MANYLWVGGYTGFTGTNSGWSGQYGGVTGRQVWTSVASGATSSFGDMFYAPYAWNLPQNWRLRIGATANPGGFNYISTTNTPAGNDAVYFGSFGVDVTGSSGPVSSTGGAIAPYNISCLFGGMSGDGPTAFSGATGWANGTTANRYGNVTFYVNSTFKPTSNPFGFRTGEIGIGVTGTNDLSLHFPLRIRTADFLQSFDNSTPPQKVAVKNLGTSTNSLLQSNATSSLISGSGNCVVSGTWYNIVQAGGTMYLTDCTTTYLGVQQSIGSFYSDNTNLIEYAFIRPYTCSGQISMWGSQNPLTYLEVGTWNPNGNFFNLGDFGTGTLPTVTEFKTLGLGFGGSGTGQAIRLGSVQIDLLKADAAKISVHPNVGNYDYCIIRDGYIKNGSIDMSHPTITNWQNFLLGYSPSDEGLRVDSPNVVMKCFAGQSLVSASEAITGS
jgi:hypothetical protein